MGHPFGLAWAEAKKTICFVVLNLLLLSLGSLLFVDVDDVANLASSIAYAYKARFTLPHFGFYGLILGRPWGGRGAWAAHLQRCCIASRFKIFFGFVYVLGHSKRSKG